MKIEIKLKSAREEAGLTQEQVAESISVSRQTVSNWENGRSLPDIISIMKLSDLYGVDIDSLLMGDKKLTDKVQKDAKMAKVNKSVVFSSAIIAFAAILIYFISSIVGGAFYDFCEAAIKWVLLGIGLASAVIAFSAS